MTSRNSLDDDAYVAKLLAEDARKTSIKYSNLGLSTLLPKRPTNTAPKPNTRFLKNIIRETDSHNAALKKKERLEAQSRLRHLGQEYGRLDSPGSGEWEERPAKRRHVEEDGDRHLAQHSRHPKARDPRERRSGGEYNTQRSQSPSKPSRNGDHNDHSPDRYHKSRRRARSSSSSASHSRRSKYSGKQNEDKDHTHHRRRTHRPPSSENQDKERRHRQRRASRSRKASRSPSPPRRRSREIPGAASLGPISSTARPHSPYLSSSSDPLEDLVGPLPHSAQQDMSEDTPPTRIRGRGAHRLASHGAAMDTHFSKDYDPKSDLHPDSEPEDEREDWDMALEALRDRQAWKQKHADRLREAGFNETEIQLWEKSGKEKAPQDVKFIGKGEMREWDVGKESESNAKPERGDGGLETAWKRKDGFRKTFQAALGN